MDTLVFLNEYDGIKVITINGKATMNNSKTISELVEVLLEEKKYIAFNMTNCKYVDSTFLGLIATLTMKSQEQNNRPLLIINPNDVVLASLKQTGLYKFVEIKEIEDISSKLLTTEEIINKTFENKIEHAEYVLKMHKILSDLNDENKEMFKNVINQMEALLKINYGK